MLWVEKCKEKAVQDEDRLGLDFADRQCWVIHTVLAAAGLGQSQWPMSSSKKSKDFSARHSALPMLGLHKPSAVQYRKPQR